MSARGVTEDAFLGGAVRVFQPEAGFRAGLDSVLVAASLPEIEGDVLELGCGSGAALLCAGARLGSARLLGVDADEAMLDLARRGIAANGFGARVGVERADAARMPADWENRFDLVFSNPPFFEPGAVSDPGAGKDEAYRNRVGLEGWIKAMLFAAKPRAPIVLIHRAGELSGILAALHRRAGEMAVLPIRPAPGAEAKRVLVMARKGLRPGPLRLLAGLDLHVEPGGAQTDRARAALEDGRLNWV